MIGILSFYGINKTTSLNKLPIPKSCNNAGTESNFRRERREAVFKNR